MLVRRQFLARYQQSILGVLWALLTPLGSLFVFWLLFGLILEVPSNGFPYVVFAFSGMVPWTAFSNSTNVVASSLQEQMGIVSKIYFPRILLPFVSLCREAIDSLISLFLLLALCAFFGFFPTWRFLFLPLIMGSALLSGFAIGLVFAGPLVRYRDLRAPLTYFMQLAMYLTPVVYPPTLIPPQYSWIFELNPMYWVIEGARWAILGQAAEITPLFFVCVGAMSLLILIGWLTFAFTERSIVDVQ